MPAFGLLLLAFGTKVTIAAPQSGIQISPLRDFITVKPGQQKSAKLLVTNLSSQPETINMSLKTFSVSDYTYDYKFSAPKSNWIHFSQNSVKLDAGDSQEITYYISPDSTASPRGYYYTLVASATIGGGTSSASTVQAATLLYMTVDGDLVKTGQVDNTRVQRLVFGRNIDYSFDVKNSGNVHYFVSTSSRLYGIFADGNTSPISNLVMPGTTRRVEGSIHSPLLPGLYRVAVTYQTDGGLNYTTSRYLFYFPPWTLALIFGIILIYRGLRKSKRTGNGAKKPKTGQKDRSEIKDKNS